MATLAGQRAQFTWSLNQYNLAEDPETRAAYAKCMARYIAAAPANGFTVAQITQGQSYPEAEVERYLSDPTLSAEPEISEEQAVRTLQNAVDTSDVLRLGDGPEFVYAYGYRCLPGRLKIGSTTVDTVQRIAAQIGTSTPDKPALYLEIKTISCRMIERAIQAVLEARHQKLEGGGAEWYMTNREKIVRIFEFIIEDAGAAH